MTPHFITRTQWVNTLRLRQNGHHFADNNFKCIFLNENICVLINVSLQFVPKGPINNIPALIQTKACRWPGDKPLSEPMMVSLLTHIWITQPEWVIPVLLVPGRCGSNFKSGIFKLMLQIEFFVISFEITIRWMLQNLLISCQHWLGAVLACIDIQF